MTTLNQAVETVKSFAKQHKAVLQVAEVLEELVDLENARKEVIDKTEKAQVAEKLMKNNIFHLSNELERAEQKFFAKQFEAKEVLKIANTAANDLMSKAFVSIKEKEDEALRVVRESKEKTEKQRVEHNRLIVEWKQKEDKLKAAVEKLRSEFTSLKERFDI